MKFTSVHVPPGDCLIHEGDLIEALYFVARGCVELSAGGVCLVVLGILLSYPFSSALLYAVVYTGFHGRGVPGTTGEGTF